MIQPHLEKNVIQLFSIHTRQLNLIRQLPEEYRRVLELRFVAEWSLGEIAQAMGLTESAVKTRVFRGRKMLLKSLQKEGYLDGRACI